jgi:lipopolysaccharide/colanic/teichoic acid biosynthesis glycosyltransferase
MIRFMNTVNYNTKNDFANQQLESVSINTKKKRYLFITDANKQKQYSSILHIALFSSSYAEAKELLLSKEQLPEIIVIDTPLQHLELIEFKVWLTALQLNNIPIVYNEKALNQKHISQLFSQKLVDDVMLLDENFDKLSQKVVFFQKYLYTKNNPVRIKKVSKMNGREEGSSVIRFLDIVLAAIALVFFSPLILLIAIAIRIESKGPIFYSSPRAGKGFKIFDFYKFRTMVADADTKMDDLSKLNLYANGSKQANFFKLKDDPRITKFGKFLRNSSLDELPQLFNVLKGDMSIVGNRPLPLYEATTLTTDEWAERFMAPAGITGLWQITKRGKSEMSNEERILLDITYARNRTLKGDLKILLQTPGALFQKANV